MMNRLLNINFSEDLTAAYTHIYLKDHLGSITDLVDPSGNVVQSYLYEAFGNPKLFDSTGTEIGMDQAIQRVSYTGREFDIESGLYFYRARYYNSLMGRFISEDPIGFEGGDKNLRRYTSNRPTVFADPDGKAIVGRICSVVSAGFAVKSYADAISFSNQFDKLQDNLNDVRQDIEDLEDLARLKKPGKNSCNRNFQKEINELKNEEKSILEKQAKLTAKEVKSGLKASVAAATAAACALLPL